jgi:hypothetical protein
LYNCQYQGVQAGCSDVYDETLPCQWIDITDLDKDPNYSEETPYILQVTVNQQGILREQDYENNVARAVVVIRDIPIKSTEQQWNGIPNGSMRK